MTISDRELLPAPMELWSIGLRVGRRAMTLLVELKIATFARRTLHLDKTGAPLEAGK